MGAPNSVISDMLQLCILAGKRTNNQTGAQLPSLTPEGIQPVTQFGQDNWPHALLRSDLFLYTVPKGQCLIVTYVGMHTGLADGSDPAVNFGIPVQAQVQWKITKAGATIGVTPLLNCIAYTNTPIFFAFEGGSLPILSFVRNSSVTTDSLAIQAQMQGYLLDGSYYSLFRKYQTIPVTT